MFATLLESKGSRKTHSRWLPASAVIHVALLAAVVMQSRPVEGHETEAPELPNIVWVAPPQRAATGPAGSGATPVPAEPARPESRMPIFDGASVADLPDLPPSTAAAALGEDDILSPGTRLGTPGASGASSGGDGGPRWSPQVEKVALPLPGNPVPAYPAVLRTAGIEGGVTVRFVIDTAGRVEPGSIVPLRSEHELFTAATLRALQAHRFLPAEAGGRKVRMLVEQRFEFALELRPR